jgi:asparagine synthase (glutamine-hydrolysing)
MLPDGHHELDSHAVVRHYLGALDGRLATPDVLQKIPYMELKLRLPEHLLMRVDKLTMAHAVEARVPFLDHELVEWSMQVPPSYKLRNGVGKWLLKRAAAPYLDRDMIHRRKQGFGAPMEEWFQDDEFAARARRALERSDLAREGLFDLAYARALLERQTSGRGSRSFELWTLLNAVLWYESWINGRTDCFS